MSETLTASCEVKEQRGPISCEVKLKPVISASHRKENKNLFF